jgi:hypothetical protein
MQATTSDPLVRGNSLWCCFRESRLKSRVASSKLMVVVVTVPQKNVDTKAFLFIDKIQLYLRLKEVGIQCKSSNYLVARVLPVTEVNNKQMLDNE